jgi:hypothetical protein
MLEFVLGWDFGGVKAGRGLRLKDVKGIFEVREYHF